MIRDNPCINRRTNPIVLLSLVWFPYSTWFDKFSPMKKNQQNYELGSSSVCLFYVKSKGFDSKQIDIILILIYAKNDKNFNI
jgi:hypothetical protein